MYLHPLPSREYLAARLDYNPDTGIFIWKPKPATCWQNIMFNSKFAGKQAGAIHGYSRIRIDGIKYHAHRLAWKMTTGEDPVDKVDHKDRVPENNRIDNLRDASSSQNKCNETLRKDNTTGYKGVRRQNGGYVARISINNKRHYLGTFDTAEEAFAVYCEAQKNLHGDFARVK
jgi:hypothetical protein